MVPRAVVVPPREVRAEAAVPAVESLLVAVPAVGTAGFLSAAALPGLLMRVLVRLEAVVEAVGFFSSSLALTLARLRWVAVVEEEVGRRTVPAAAVVDEGGRVGGLLRPAAAVVLPPAAEVVEVAATGRLEADVAVAPVALDEAVVPGARPAAALLDMVVVVVAVWLDATTKLSGGFSEAQRRKTQGYQRKNRCLMKMQRGGRRQGTIQEGKYIRPSFARFGQLVVGLQGKRRARWELEAGSVGARERRWIWWWWRWRKDGGWKRV